MPLICAPNMQRPASGRESCGGPGLRSEIQAPDLPGAEFVVEADAHDVVADARGQTIGREGGIRRRAAEIDAAEIDVKVFHFPGPGAGIRNDSFESAARG